MTTISGGIVYNKEQPEICFLTQVYIWLAIYVAVLVRASPNSSARISQWYLTFGDQQDPVFEFLNPKYLSIILTTFGILLFVFFVRGLAYFVKVHDLRKEEEEEEEERVVSEAGVGDSEDEKLFALGSSEKSSGRNDDENEVEISNEHGDENRDENGDENKHENRHEKNTFENTHENTPENNHENSHENSHENQKALTPTSYVDDNSDDNSIAALISKDFEIHGISLETSETEQNACFSRTDIKSTEIKSLKSEQEPIMLVTSDVCMTDVGEIEPTAQCGKTKKKRAKTQKKICLGFSGQKH